MPGRWSHWRSGRCGGKCWYETEDSASADIARVTRGLTELGRLKGELHAYRCPECTGWHLTTAQLRPFNAHGTNGRRDVALGDDDMVNARALLRLLWASRTNP